MNVLIFDSAIERARKNAAAFLPLARVFLKRGNHIASLPEEKEIAEPIHCDFALLHADEDDEQLLHNLTSKGIVQVASLLRYSGGGCPDGIPWPVRDESPITQFAASQIISVCQRFPPARREQECVKMWSGVPEILVAWAMSQHFALSVSTPQFAATNIARCYNQLRSTMLLRSINKELPPECPEDAFPRLEHAKHLVTLARVDL